MRVDVVRVCFKVMIGGFFEIYVIDIVGGGLFCVVYLLVYVCIVFVCWDINVI